MRAEVERGGLAAPRDAETAAGTVLPRAGYIEPPDEDADSVPGCDCGSGMPRQSDATEICLWCVKSDWPKWAAAYGEHVRAHRAKYLRAAGVPSRFAACGLDTFETKTRDQERALVEMVAWAAKIVNPKKPGKRNPECETRNPEESAGDRGLYLHGPVGTGKTHLAVAALLEMAAAGRTVKFSVVRELLLKCRESYHDGAERRLPEILDNVLAREVLVLDDLGAEKISEFARADVLLALVDRAYTDQWPALVVTSNLSLEELARKTDPRIADRLREMCTAIRLGGPSYRRRAAAR